MNDREFLEEQARLRKVLYDPGATPRAYKIARKAMDRLMKKYSEQHPTITGTFVYSEEDVRQAKEHGF